VREGLVGLVATLGAPRSYALPGIPADILYQEVMEGGREGGLFTVEIADGDLPRRSRAKRSLKSGRTVSPITERSGADCQRVQTKAGANGYGLKCVRSCVLQNEFASTPFQDFFAGRPAHHPKANLT
jgi:hypothetical protein